MGSNALRFSGTALLNGITQIPGQNDMGYFSFNHEVDQKDRIHFAPGDVVGWFMPVSRTEIREPALSVLYVHASELNSSDSNNAVTLYASDAQLESCSVCDIEKVGDGGEIVPGVIPLMVPIVGKRWSTCYVVGYAFIFICIFFLVCLVKNPKLTCIGEDLEGGLLSVTLGQGSCDLRLGAPF